MQHVVWDWNGTLLADQHVVLDALNALLGELDHPPTDMVTYQALYTRPVRLFYERLLQRPIDDRLWDRIDDLFHGAYEAALHAADLAHDAMDALAAVAGLGRTQSLLSMARHEQLVPLVDRFGLGGHFVHVAGLTGVGGGRKASYLERHLVDVAHHAGDDPSRVLVIGDATDDAVAAEHVGAACVLYDGGSHPREELDAVGVPVASSLTEALELAGLG